MKNIIIVVLQVINILLNYLVYYCNIHIQIISSNIIKLLIDNRLLEYTNKSSVNTRNQKYNVKKI